jgi:hypothetical protein
MKLLRGYHGQGTCIRRRTTMKHKLDQTFPQVFGHVPKYNKLQTQKYIILCFTKMIKPWNLTLINFTQNFIQYSSKINYIHTFRIHGGLLFYTELENSSLLTIGEIRLYSSFLTTQHVICLQVTMVILGSISTLCSATVRHCVCCKENEMKSAQTSTSQTVSIQNTPCRKLNRNTALQKSSW